MKRGVDCCLVGRGGGVSEVEVVGGSAMVGVLRGWSVDGGSVENSILTSPSPSS